MKVWSFGAGLLACLVSSAAYAETWGVQPRLVKDRSTASCGDNTPPSTMTLVGDKLTIKGVNGTYDFKVAPDGKVDEAYRTASGMSLRIVGNAKTKDLEFVNTNAGCRYKAEVRQ